MFVCFNGYRKLDNQRAVMYLASEKNKRIAELEGALNVMNHVFIKND